MKNVVIRIVDDDEDIRSSLAFVLRADGWEVSLYSSGESFLTTDIHSSPGCVLLDIRMPGMSGLEIQQILNARGIDIPIIFLTGHGDIEMAVEAMKAGAYDFLVKPVDNERLLTTISRTLRKANLPHSFRLAQAQAHWDSLTSREKQILIFLSEGLLNRTIAERLGLSIRTIEGHRQRSMKKLGIANVAELNAFMQEINDH
jgi:FixJ family two-component response regulator